MIFRNAILGIVTVLGLVLTLAKDGSAQTRLGLHVTQEELNIWKQRSTNGPYKSAGDAGFSNTPGDWDRIVANKNSFSSNPSTEIYNGYTGAGCVPRGAAINPNSQGQKTRDAAFYSLMQNDATVRAQVLSNLLTQIAVSGTNFSNTAKWCLQPNHLGDSDPSFSVAEWVTRMLYAYDYIRASIGTTDRNNIDAWFLAAGQYYRVNSDLDIVTHFYNSSEANFFAGTLNSSGVTASNTSAGVGTTYQGGPTINQISQWYNNRRGQMMGTYGQIGVMLGNAQLINWSKAWIKEWLKFGIFPDTSPAEMYRSGTDGAGPDQGWQYAAEIFGRAVDVADALARTGDLELYNYTTTAGGLAGGTPAKTLKTAATWYYSTTQGVSPAPFYYGTPADVNHLIDGVVMGKGYYAYDTYLAKGNVFWQDANFKTAYMNPGAANKQGVTTILNANRGWMGPAQAHPGVLFMFGQMEGKVFPFSTSTVSPPPAPLAPPNPPSSLVLQTTTP